MQVVPFQEYANMTKKISQGRERPLEFNKLTQSYVNTADANFSKSVEKMQKKEMPNKFNFVTDNTHLQACVNDVSLV